MNEEEIRKAFDTLDDLDYTPAFLRDRDPGDENVEDQEDIWIKGKRHKISKELGGLLRSVQAHLGGSVSFAYTPDKDVDEDKCFSGYQYLQVDPVIQPPHYTQYEVEPVTFIMTNDLPFWMGNVIKYVMRADDKNGVEDLRKAQRYIEMRINQINGKDVL